MEHVACRNCGNENIHSDTKDNKLIHYDCLDCNYEWSAPRIDIRKVVFNIIACFIGILLMIFGLLSTIVKDISDSFSAQSPAVLLFIGMALVITFTYRSLRTYRFIRK